MSTESNLMVTSNSDSDSSLSADFLSSQYNSSLGHLEFILSILAEQRNELHPK